MPDTPRLDDFRSTTAVTIRYSDTDRQGHVNNAVFATFLEAGRVAMLFDPDQPLLEPGYAFVLAHLSLDFIGEINWPGEVQIGTRIDRIGRSSIGMGQGLFQDGRCVATADTVIVLTEETTRRSHPLSPGMIAKLSRLAQPGAAP